MKASLQLHTWLLPDGLPNSESSLCLAGLQKECAGKVLWRCGFGSACLALTSNVVHILAFVDCMHVHAKGEQLADAGSCRMPSGSRDRLIAAAQPA